MFGFFSGIYLRNEFYVPTHGIVYNDVVNKFNDDLINIKNLQNVNKE